MHRNTITQCSGKKKPSVVLYYNKNKIGVDIVDNMLKLNSARWATKRWPIAVWENLLDVATLNAWICYRDSTGSSIKRIPFLLQLMEQLCGIQNTTRPQPLMIHHYGRNRKRRSCKGPGCKNKSSVVCQYCEREFCGPCTSESAIKVTLIVCSGCECNM